MKSNDYLDLLMHKQPLAKWRAIRNTLQQETGLFQGDFELIFELYEISYFTTEDFRYGTLLLNWDKRRWKRMLKDGWIEMYRERDQGAHHRYNIYELSRKSKAIVRRAYRIISSVDPIPTKIFSIKKTYGNKLLGMKVNQLNDLRTELDELRPPEQQHAKRPMKRRKAKRKPK